jgi:hypothetical protein
MRAGNFDNSGLTTGFLDLPANGNDRQANGSYTGSFRNTFNILKIVFTGFAPSSSYPSDKRKD